ncbi:PH domain-containing protein [Pelodictyon luteolum]|uniref:YdbS-like PH domain-containing protein n=1 Tax=Chlorobium luteolum (strain DSM 273 / BCRC 81028 / 2530) TaxID=319225 RepID=Q3B4N8_CHLL3|nr:PH domain-containing protein [Pelodictyon luteolum]ABB23693.1 conserved hypothetical protein [Pelodictyon luteolum DSM 273]
MGYVDNNMLEGEVLYATGRLHWIIFSRAIAFAAAAAGLLIYALVLHTDGRPDTAKVPISIGQLLLLPAIWYGIAALVRRQSTELAITSKRVIAKFGFIRRSTIELNHSKVESFHVDQSVLGRMLGFGTLNINGTGGGVTPIPRVTDPLGFRRRAIEAIDDSQKRNSA